MTGSFAQTHSACHEASMAESFYRRVLQLREACPPQDDIGLIAPESATRQSAWQRANAFTAPA